MTEKWLRKYGSPEARASLALVDRIENDCRRLLGEAQRTGNVRLAEATLAIGSALLEASNASAAQRPPDSSVAETPEEEH